MAFHIFEMKSLFYSVIIIGTVVFCNRYTSSEDSLPAVSKPALTTTKARSSASPKPKSLFKRLDVEVSNTSLNLFRVRPYPERRRDMDSVWKWDLWCHLQPEVGNCSSAHAKRQQQQEGPREGYFYDSQLDKCSTFNYSGCEGNKNNFQTLEECKRHCEGSSYVSLNDTKRPIYCTLQPNVGLCLALMERYYYDVNKDDCKLFIYGGCGGNQNRFHSKELCNDKCKGKK